MLIVGPVNYHRSNRNMSSFFVVINYSKSIITAEKVVREFTMRTEANGSCLKTFSIVTKGTFSIVACTSKVLWSKSGKST